MKIEIIKPIWGFKVGEKKDLAKDKAEFAIERGKAIKVGAKKAIEKAPKNKAIEKAPVNKDFIGSHSMK
jgi:hypothetical protein